MGNSLITLREKIKRKEIRLCVVGLGYVGLPLAIEFAKKGLEVLGLEIDKERLKRLSRKESYITDVPEEELGKVLRQGKLTASSQFSLLEGVDCIIICVPTPLKRKFHPDISFITQAVRSVSKHIKKPSLVILESTTYPGTTDEVILPLLEKSGLRHGKDFYLCFSPERIDPGNTKYPLSRIPKVIGGITHEAAALGKLLYEIIIDKVMPVSSAKVAETAKLLENTFRIVNIGLIDELAMMCHKMGINIWEVVEAAKTKPFGFMPFYPGPGVGGHCIGKDPLYLYWKAKSFGFKSRFIKLSSDVTNYMPQYVVERVLDLLKANELPLNKLKVLVIGVTYKKDVKDLRKSPALDMIEILQKRNVSVSYYDPLIPFLKINTINLKSITLNAANLRNFDCVVITTDHSKINYALLLRSARLIFDTRNVFKGKENPRLVRL
ncbi:MAG: nucleotide sugar dehydrogenase [Candidatus Omnitrophota bacterium]